MIDLGISRVQDLQAGLPGVQSPARVQGDKSKGQNQQGEVTPTNSSDAVSSESEPDVVREEISLEEAKRRVEELNQLLGSNRELQFTVNQEAENIRIEIVDTETGKVIKTVPPGELPQVASRLQSGNLFVDDVS